jgi:GAF domain-containing protein
MTNNRRDRIVAEIVRSVSPEMDPQRLSGMCAEVTGVSGAGIVLMPDEAPWQSLNTSNQVSARLDELQISLIEGPAVDAHQCGQPVFEPDLDDPRTERWPAFSGPAIEAGIRAVFGFPLRVGGVRLGALDLHSRRPGLLKSEQHLDALMLADVVSRAILLVQAQARPAQLASELRMSSDYQSIVNQASGMAAVQLGVGVGAALVRMRVHAFEVGRPFAEVADDVVARRLRFEPERPEQASVHRP